MRRAAKVDENQPDIVEALYAVGATVQHLHSVGQGCPDLLVGFRGGNHLLEVKSLVGKREPKPAPLTPAQKIWLKAWRGRAAIVATPAEALLAIGACKASL